MIINEIRLSNQSKDKLAKLKGKTGIQNWNTLCRWALCYSLCEPTMPTDLEYIADSNVEMTWHVFAGEYSELYEALIRERCIKDGLGTEPEILKKYLRLHLNRGINHLSGTNVIKSLTDLLELAVK